MPRCPDSNTRTLLQTRKLSLASDTTPCSMQLRLSVEANERKTFEDAQQKSKSLEPDLIIHFPEGPLWVDLSVTEPTAPSLVRNNCFEVGAAMNIRAATKNTKYLSKARSVGGLLAAGGGNARPVSQQLSHAAQKIGWAAQWAGRRTPRPLSNGNGSTDQPRSGQRQCRSRSQSDQ